MAGEHSPREGAGNWEGKLGGGTAAAAACQLLQGGYEEDKPSSLLMCSVGRQATVAVN